MTDQSNTVEDKLEQLAAIEHERWADWQRWVHSVCLTQKDGSLVIPAALVERWERQIGLRYKDLSEQEKESDREQVRRYWPIIQALLTEARETARMEGWHEGRAAANNPEIQYGYSSDAQLTPTEQLKDKE